jgi:hypothetical protein
VRTLKIGEKIYGENDEPKENEPVNIKLVNDINEQFSPNPLRKLSNREESKGISEGISF